MFAFRVAHHAVPVFSENTMHAQRQMALAVLVLWPVAAAAQLKPVQPESTVHLSGQHLPVDGTYSSAFAGYQRFSEDDTTPDTRWRVLNDEVGRLRGHAGHMTGEVPHPGGASFQAPSPRGAHVPETSPARRSGHHGTHPVGK